MTDLGRAPDRVNVNIQRGFPFRASIKMRDGSDWESTPEIRLDSGDVWPSTISGDVASWDIPAASVDATRNGEHLKLVYGADTLWGEGRLQEGAGVGFGGRSQVLVMPHPGGGQAITSPAIKGDQGETPTLVTGTTTEVAPGGTPSFTLIETSPGTYAVDAALVTGAPGGSDAATAAWITGGTQTPAALKSSYLSVNEGPYDVHRAGVIGGGDDTATIRAALANAGVGAQVRFRPGVTYQVSDYLGPKEGQIVDATGATIRVKDGSTPFSGIMLSAGAKPFTLIGGTFDLNKTGVQAATSAETQYCAVHIAAPAAGWAGEYVVRNIRVINALGNAVRVVGASSAVMPTTGSDAINAPLSRVTIDRLTTEGCLRGLVLSRVYGAVVTNVSIVDSEKDGIAQYLTRNAQIIGGQIRNAGTLGPQQGHGMVDQYGVGTLWQGVDVMGASYSGVTAGGGDASTWHTRGFRWIGMTATGCGANGLSVDPTLAGVGSGHTLDMYSQITASTASGNGIHGLYLHSTANVAVTGFKGFGNASGGVAGDAYQTTVTASEMRGNSFGLNLQGGPAPLADGSPAGVSGKFTGYGRWRVGSDVRMFDNTTEDLMTAASTSGYIGSTVDSIGSGSPEGAVRAPVGSTYRDTATGDLYAKTTHVLGTGSTGKTGWKKVTLV